MSAKRQWLMSARDRVCGYCDATVKPKLWPDGRITSTCTCGKTAERQSKDYYEQRACERCRFTRRVTVSVFHDGSLHAKKLCDACVLDQSAAVHYATAKRLHAKATAIRAKRTP